MPPSIVVNASIRIEAPADTVRAHYRDVDHHIRNRVHSGTTYEWAAPERAGERRVKRTFRILGVVKHDWLVHEDTPDGRFVLRCVGGTHAGLVVAHEFAPLEPAATEVRVSARAPTTLVPEILGPLLQLGLRLILRRSLHEDKIDIEKRGYRHGRAAGNVARALAPVDEAVAMGLAPDGRRAIVSGACLVATADGVVDDAERDAIRIIAEKVGVNRAWATREIARHEQLARLPITDAYAVRADEIGRELVATCAAEPCLVAAALAALVSCGMSLSELEVLRALASAGGYPERKLPALVARLDADLMNART